MHLNVLIIDRIVKPEKHILIGIFMSSRYTNLINVIIIDAIEAIGLIEMAFKTLFPTCIPQLISKIGIVNK